MGYDPVNHADPLCLLGVYLITGADEFQALFPSHRAEQYGHDHHGPNSDLYLRAGKNGFI